MLNLSSATSNTPPAVVSDAKKTQTSQPSGGVNAQKPKTQSVQPRAQPVLNAVRAKPASSGANYCRYVYV